MDKFLRAVIGELRRHGIEASRAPDGEALLVGDRRVAMDIYFLAYEGAGLFGRGAVVRQTATAIAGLVAGDHVFDSYDVALPRLRARVTTDAAIDRLRLTYVAHGGSTKPVARAIVADLMIEPVIDREHDRALIGRDLLAHWAVTTKQAIDDAIEASAGRPISFEQVSRLWVHASDDGLGSSSLFALERMLDRMTHDPSREARDDRDQWRAHVDVEPARAVVVIPDRDHVLVLDRDDELAWLAAAAFVGGVADLGEALSAVAITRRDGAWVEVPPPAVVAPLFDDARAAIVVARYEAQRPILAHVFRDLHPAAGETREDAGALVTSSRYTRGQPALLPVTERVAFVDPARPHDIREVAWDQLATLQGLAVEPFGVVPPRWRVEGWPTE